MKKGILLLAAITLVVLAASLVLSIGIAACGGRGSACWAGSSHSHASASTGPPTANAKVSYMCPMHPEVVQDRPGKCPKCGMSLEAMASEKVTYVCPMHSDAVSDRPGKCPKCGMNLDKRTKKVSYQYTCPMHPEVVQDKSGQCPKCGMFLEAKPVGDKPGSATAPPPDTHAGHAH